jgi:hypothetical protein
MWSHPPAARCHAAHARAGAEIGAEEAKAYWSEGRSCPRDALTGLDEALHAELFADFDTANQQALNTENL